ncbi:hypothetical protein R3P38DRAFT_3081746 [Favolaschia claudopus]|uniref:Uncharacterized protein n=1 Tax=Favolaschia claudopus TaxID=2862362 RepID=A0AAV9ZVF2_9AGAR
MHIDRIGLPRSPIDLLHPIERFSDSKYGQSAHHSKAPQRFGLERCFKSEESIPLSHYHSSPIKHSFYYSIFIPIPLAMLERIYGPVEIHPQTPLQDALEDFVTVMGEICPDGRPLTTRLENDEWQSVRKALAALKPFYSVEEPEVIAKAKKTTPAANSSGKSKSRESGSSEARASGSGEKRNNHSAAATSPSGSSKRKLDASTAFKSSYLESEAARIKKEDIEDAKLKRFNDGQEVGSSDNPIVLGMNERQDEEPPMKIRRTFKPGDVIEIESSDDEE